MLTSLLNNFTNIRILVIGDLMLDHYIWGEVHRISPEAPVPVVHVNRDSYTAGGAANVALNLTNLGVQTSILGYFAQDEAGQQLFDILSNSRVDVLNPKHASNAPTIIKTRVIVRSQQLCRIDREAARDIYNIDSTSDFEDLMNHALENVDAVILSDYAKGVITQPLLDYVLNFHRHHPNLIVAIDPKPSRHLSYSGMSLLTPNRYEATELAGMKNPLLGEEYPIDEVCYRIHQMYKPQLLVITLGAEGMVISSNGKVLERLPTEAREVFDVSGAGDTVIAALTAALALGETPGKAARLANAAAGCVVAHMGTAPVVKEELQHWLEKKNKSMSLT